MRKSKQTTIEQDIADTLEGIKATIGVGSEETFTTLGVLANHSKNIHLALVAIFAQLVALEKRIADPSADTAQDFAQNAIDKIVALGEHPQFTSTYIKRGTLPLR